MRTLQRSPGSWLYLRGPTSKGREGKRKREGVERGEKGREEEGGRGGASPLNILA